MGGPPPEKCGGCEAHTALCLVPQCTAITSCTKPLSGRSWAVRPCAGKPAGEWARQGRTEHPGLGWAGPPALTLCPFPLSFKEWTLTTSLAQWPSVVSEVSYAALALPSHPQPGGSPMSRPPRSSSLGWWGRGMHRGG